jgi:hypothetical protein
MEEDLPHASACLSQTAVSNFREGFSRRSHMCIIAQMSIYLKYILGTIVIASIAGATIQPVALAQTTGQSEREN